MRRWFLASALAVSVAAVASAAEPVDEAVIARIKVEGFQHAAVMDTLSWLSDVYGPRLSGSPGLRRAEEWARDRLTSWGLAHAALEPYDTTYRGWELHHFDIQMTAPQYVRIYGYPLAWSPATRGAITGTPIVTDVRSTADFEKYHGTLRGAIVMNGRPATIGPDFEAEAHRLTRDELAKQGGAQSPASPDGDAPPSLEAEERDFDKSLDKELAIEKSFAGEGVAAVVTPSSIPEDLRVDGYYDFKWQATYPTFVIAREPYGRIVRMLDRKVAVTLALSLDATITPGVQGVNVVAEIPGADPAIGGQIVMLGAHLDSWHSGTGATDNGAGCAAVMEAVRILQAIGVKPRRTIRVALWTGEEQDYYGSVGYVRAHFGDPSKRTTTGPEHDRLAAYFNLDNGSGRIRGVNLQGNEAVRPIFEAWLAPFHYLGASTLTTLNTGGTDHMVFNAVGLPGFQFLQDPLNYGSRVHHSSLDVYEEAVPADLEQAAVILASFAYHAAMRDEMLPRPPGPPAVTEDAPAN